MFDKIRYWVTMHIVIPIGAIRLFAQDYREGSEKQVKLFNWKRIRGLFTYKRFLIGAIIWDAFFAGFDFAGMILDFTVWHAIGFGFFELGMALFMVTMWWFMVSVYRDEIGL